MPPLPARLVVAGTHSGVGKTTVATGLMAALRARGHVVGAAKVGPDFIDPGYHALATGRPSRNVDIWMSGPGGAAACAGRAAEGTDLLVVEGVMGLFDGASDGTPSSSADVAALLGAPVVLVVDCAAQSQSVAALVRGFATHDPRIRLGGLILNRVGSPGHEAMLRTALEPLGIPVLGVLLRDDRLGWRDRHLGLVPVVEQPERVGTALHVLAEVIAQRCDLDAIVALARSAGPGTVPAPALAEPVAPAGTGKDAGRSAMSGASAARSWHGTGHAASDSAPHRPSEGARRRRASGAEPAVRIAVASGPAFSFTYPDNLDALTAAGAEIVPFDPCTAPALPEGCQGLIAGGGFPEVYAERLAANRPLVADVARRVRAGLVTWAECGGLLWLCTRLGGHAMAGALPATARMTERLTLGYCTATTTVDTPLGPAGTVLRGHEFHYSTVEPGGDLLELSGRHGTGRGGFGGPALFASYLHVHLAARPDLARSFVAACSALRVPYAH